VRDIKFLYFSVKSKKLIVLINKLIIIIKNRSFQVTSAEESRCLYNPFGESILSQVEVVVFAVHQLDKSLSHKRVLSNLGIYDEALAWISRSLGQKVCAQNIGNNIAHEVKQVPVLKSTKREKERYSYQGEGRSYKKKKKKYCFPKGLPWLLILNFLPSIPLSKTFPEINDCGVPNVTKRIAKSFYTSCSSQYNNLVFHYIAKIMDNQRAITLNLKYFLYCLYTLFTVLLFSIVCIMQISIFHPYIFTILKIQ
ncbi:hypothetical protein Anas_14378, partial [Armadillidium nasatum]